MPQDTGLDAADWAQIAAAAFTALAAAAACASVFRVERDRWRQTLPDLHMEVIADVPQDEMRLLLVNHGAPAREVRVLGVVGPFGFIGNTPPTAYWKPGESRTYRLSMPLQTDETIFGFVEGRDLGKKHLVIGTAGGASYRWPLRKAKKMSAQKQWEKLFPESPTPLDVPNTPMAMELVDRSA